ncbi:MAG: PAS domain S-box protein, partial [Acidimicrobiia bacterium]
MAAPEIPSAAGLHGLLARQLRRLDIDPRHGVDAAQLGALLERVTRTYEAADQDRYLIERSLEVSSREMGHLYEELRRSSETALASQRDQLRSILDSAAEGIVTTDETGHVETFNRAAEKMFGWTARQIDGRDVSELLIGGLASEPLSSLLSRLVDKRGPGSESATLEGRRRDGSR